MDETQRPVGKFPRSRSSILIGRAIRRLKAKKPSERIQLMVTAGLMTQEAADRAKAKLEALESEKAR